MPGDHLEHALGQICRQCRSDLIEHEHVRLDRQRSREVDHPQGSQRQIPNHAGDVEVRETELGEPVSNRLDRGRREAQVRADVEIGDEGRFLVDRDDAAATRLGG